MTGHQALYQEPVYSYNYSSCGSTEILNHTATSQEVNFVLFTSNFTKGKHVISGPGCFQSRSCFTGPHKHSFSAPSQRFFKPLKSTGGINNNPSQAIIDHTDQHSQMFEGSMMKDHFQSINICKDRHACDNYSHGCCLTSESTYESSIQTHNKPDLSQGSFRV